MDPRTRDKARRGAIDAVAMGWGWETPSDRPLPPPRASAPLWLRILAFVGILATAAVLAGFVLFVYSLDRVERRPSTRTDAIVALTGGAQRIGDAIDLLDRGYASRLLITGVNERTSREQIARLNPGQRRLFDCCVDLDYRARNTIGNAIETRRWMHDNGFRSLIVVTSNYHMRRTLLELDHVMPDARKVPFAVVPDTVDVDSWWRSPSTAKFLAYEYAKLIAVYLRTRFEGDPERSAAATLMGGGRRPVKMVAEPFGRR
jgi:uncharacterized SAM-binding protein YcdF (DUF218 family)